MQKALLLLCLVVLARANMLKMSSPYKFVDTVTSGCDAVNEVAKSTLQFPESGTPPWDANPNSAAFYSPSVTTKFDELAKERVPGLTATFGEVFSMFQAGGCLIYPHGGSVRDYLLRGWPRDIDVEYSCSPQTLYQLCVNAYTEQSCHFTATSPYFYIGEKDISTFDELEGVNWNSTIFGPLYAKEYTTNTLSYDTNGNNVIIDVVGYGVNDTCSRIIRIPVPQDQWTDWLFEQYLRSHNGLKKLPRFWKLRATPKNFKPADDATLEFIVDSVKTLWSSTEYPVEKIFRQFYCAMVGGVPAFNEGCYYVKGSVSEADWQKVTAYNNAFIADIGQSWYNTYIVGGKVNTYIPYSNEEQYSDYYLINGGVFGYCYAKNTSYCYTFSPSLYSYGPNITTQMNVLNTTHMQIVQVSGWNGFLIVPWVANSLTRLYNYNRYVSGMITVEWQNSQSKLCKEGECCIGNPCTIPSGLVLSFDTYSISYTDNNDPYNFGVFGRIITNATYSWTSWAAYGQNFNNYLPVTPGICA